MNKHTPGPWAIDWNIGRLDIHSSGPLIATVPRNVRDDEADRVAQQNARLIAAAPELLSALQAIVTSLADHDDEGMIEHAEQMVTARAAIAKATGK